MKDLIERSYRATKGRGLINSDTVFIDFVEKLKEETQEIEELMDEKGAVKFVDMQKYIDEWIDAMNVCLNFLRHHNVDIEANFEQVIKKNEKRATTLNN